MLPPHVYASVDEFHLDRVCGGYTDALFENAKLEENALLARDPDQNEGTTSSSSNFISSDSPDSEEEEGEEANQLVLNMRKGGQPIVASVVPIVTLVVLVIPILVSSSNLEDFDDLAFAPTQPIGEDVIAHSYLEGGGSDMSLGEVNMAPRLFTGSSACFGNTAPSEARLSRASELKRSKKKIKKISSLERQSSELKRSKKKISSLEKQAKLDSTTAKQMKLDLAAAIQEKDASYVVVTEAQGEVAAVQEQLNKALGDLSKLERVSYSPVYERVFNQGND
ncbi:hypothetical protein Acr_00g0065920 [Actinidia rufa]|uniref:Uncharacterized protein n=1 Tax=Actinidia rufa TaxID=165716 RepID=A0A7J0DRD5_9ERIC|nr:hypothetical protein Acr_00g0065920 [Actinidia rufa]